MNELRRHQGVPHLRLDEVDEPWLVQLLILCICIIIKNFRIKGINKFFTFVERCGSERAVLHLAEAPVEQGGPRPSGAWAPVSGSMRSRSPGPTFGGRAGWRIRAKVRDDIVLNISREERALTRSERIRYRRSIW